MPHRYFAGPASTTVTSPNRNRANEWESSSAVKAEEGEKRTSLRPHDEQIVMEFIQVSETTATIYAEELEAEGKKKG
jgi:hypothetical protein